MFESAGDLHDWARAVSATTDHADRVDAALDLQSALLSLTPRERACIVLHYMDDMAVDGVAATLGLAPGTVKRYLADGRSRLRSLLPGMDFSDYETVPISTRKGGAR